MKREDVLQGVGEETTPMVSSNLPFIVLAGFSLDLCGAVGRQTWGTVGDPGTVLRWVHIVGFSPPLPLSPREIESEDFDVGLLGEGDWFGTSWI